METSLNIRDTWATPPDFRKAIVNAFGFPDLDVCASKTNYFGHNFYDEAMDGLKQPWKKNVFCNPPGSEVAKWVRKAASEPTRSLVLVQQGLETEWYHEAKTRCITLLLTPRIQFIPPFGIPKSSNPRNYMLLVFEPWMAKLPKERIETWRWK